MSKAKDRNGDTVAAVRRCQWCPGRGKSTQLPSVVKQIDGLLTKLKPVLGAFLIEVLSSCHYMKNTQTAGTAPTNP